VRIAHLGSRYLLPVFALHYCMQFFSFWAVISAALLCGACSRNEAHLDRRADATLEPRVASTAAQVQSPEISRPGDGDRSGASVDGAALSRVLPEHAGDFAAGPLDIEPQFVRREYVRGNTRISVTIALPNATPMTYEDWVKASASSPQVTLDIFPKSGSGFYDCASKGTDELCHVHIHLRSGHHVEMMGQRNAHRADFDALLKQLPLRTLS
jgi:hypothetical protein